MWYTLKQQHRPHTLNSCSRAVWTLQGEGWRAGALWPPGTLGQAPIYPAVAPWTASLRGTLQAPELCVPCLSLRPRRTKTTTAEPCSMQQVLLAGQRQGDTASCRSREATAALDSLPARWVISPDVSEDITPVRLDRTGQGCLVDLFASCHIENTVVSLHQTR